MKYLLFASLTLAGAQATAQTAAVESFDGAERPGFMEIVHHRVPPPVTPPPTVEEVPQGTPMQSSDISATAGISAPAWMRPHSSIFSDYRMRAQAMPTGPCGPAAFKPVSNISRSAQQRRAAFYNRMSKIACEEGVPVDLFDALIIRESRYRPMARSHKGAGGLTQLMPGTARDLGVRNVYDPEENMRGGARYLRKMLDRFDKWHLALGAYNAGPGRIDQYGGLPPFKETRDYVEAIMLRVRDLSSPSYAVASRPARPPAPAVKLTSFSR